MSKEFLKRLASSIILITIVLFFVFKGYLLFYLFILTCFFISLYEWNKICSKKKYKFIGFLFLTFSFYSVYKIFNYNDNNLYFLYVILISVSTDIGGYIFGNIFKGPKLTKISPKKTYSGALGGFILSIITLFLFFIYLELHNHKIESTISEFIIVVIISTISQLGDIVVSYFKRLSNLKDTGKIIPGHGGLLDRIDGMIFAFPFTYFMISTKFLSLF